MFLSNRLYGQVHDECWDGYGATFSVAEAPKLKNLPTSHYIVLVQDKHSKDLVPMSKKTFANTSILASKIGLTSFQLTELITQGYLDFKKVRLILFEINEEDK